MTPQSSFMVIAPLAMSKVPQMRQLLASMNRETGTADPYNCLIPFGEFRNLHFARFLVLDDQTGGDVLRYGLEIHQLPVYLAFLGDFDGDYDEFIADLCARCGVGLRQIFSLCEGFTDVADLSAWMRQHETRPSTYYCNFVGRTVTQCREERQLQRALRERLTSSPQLADAPPREVHRELRQFLRTEQDKGHLPLTPAGETPFLWSLLHAWYVLLLILLIVGGIVTLPLTLLPLLIAAYQLRKLEKSDPEFKIRPASEWIAGLAAIEDHSITNQFSAFGTVKPGAFRRVLLTVILWAVNLSTQVLYTKGRLARVHTIHFARWVYLDGGLRLFFASNYDGSLEGYMDDFINKVAFGLNAVFSNGVSYPPSEWLVLKGAKNEQSFKYFIRRHELPTEVWYNAHDGSSAFDLERNSRIRSGLEKFAIPDRELAGWLALL